MDAEQMLKNLVDQCHISFGRDDAHTLKDRADHKSLVSREDARNSGGPSNAGLNLNCALHLISLKNVGRRIPTGPLSAGAHLGSGR